MITTISEAPADDRPIVMRRSMLHGDAFPSELPKDAIEKRLVRYVSVWAHSQLVGELEWIKQWNNYNYSWGLMTRMLTARNDWSRR